MVKRERRKASKSTKRWLYAILASTTGFAISSFESARVGIVGITTPSPLEGMVYAIAATLWTLRFYIFSAIAVAALIVIIRLERNQQKEEKEEEDENMDIQRELQELVRCVNNLRNDMSRDTERRGDGMLTHDSLTYALVLIVLASTAIVVTRTIGTKRIRANHV